MVSVRRVAPILFFAVTIPAWAAPQAATKTETTSTATSTQPASKKATKTSPAKKTAKTAPSTTSAAPAPVPAPAPATKTSATATKKAPAKAAVKKPAAKKATEKPAAKTAAKATPKTTSHPPRELHKVGDHWTPYNPPDPSTYPPGAKTYAIKQGDTLWGLAQQFFKNGYMWPQIWETNTWITDAHWIYPGDVLLIEGEIAQAEGAAGTTAGGAAAGTAGAAGTQPGTAGAGIGTPFGAPVPKPLITAADAVGGTAGPVPLATEADVYCYGYIGDPEEPMPNRILAWEDVEVRYIPGAERQDLHGSEGDLTFIDGGASTGLTAGETYMLVLPGSLVRHPHTRDIVGRQYSFIGQVKVLCMDGKHTRGIITQSCSEIPIGARLKPMPQIPIPLARIPSLPAFCDPASGKTSGYIISAFGGDWLTSLGEGQLVQIDLGRDEQVQPGEFLTVFREEVPGLPRQVLGQVAVLTTENHTATAKIVLMRFDMRIGDRVEIR